MASAEAAPSVPGLGADPVHRPRPRGWRSRPQRSGPAVPPPVRRRGQCPRGWTTTPPRPPRPGPRPPRSSTPPPRRSTPEHGGVRCPGRHAGVHGRSMPGPLWLSGGMPRVHGRSMRAGWMGLRPVRVPHCNGCGKTSEMAGMREPRRVPRLDCYRGWPEPIVARLPAGGWGGASRAMGPADATRAGVTGAGSGWAIRRSCGRRGPAPG
jgi:hypothetical protein